MKSDIPTVNDPTITFTQGGVTKGSISLNQATDQTIELDAGGSGGGSTVIANPTLSGDEATLDGLEVDGTKYKVGGSGGSEVHLYRHILKLHSLDYYSFGIVEILNDNNTPFTSELLFNKLKSNGQLYQYAVSPFRFGSDQTTSIEMSILGYETDYFHINALNYNTLPEKKPEFFSYNSRINSLNVLSDSLEQIF